MWPDGVRASVPFVDADRVTERVDQTVAKKSTAHCSITRVQQLQDAGWHAMFGEQIQLFGGRMGKTQVGLGGDQTGSLQFGNNVFVVFVGKLNEVHKRGQGITTLFQLDILDGCEQTGVGVDFF